MTSRLLIAGVAAGCVTAAGLGGFLAVRTVNYSSEAAALAESQGRVTPAEAAPTPTGVTAPVIATPTAYAAHSLPRATRPTPEGAPSPSAATATLAAAPESPIPVLSAPTSQSPSIAVNPGRDIELAGPRYELVELPANEVIGIQLETAVSSDTARVEDEVHARVTRPVVVDGVTVIPTGARLTGQVTVVESGGRFRGRSRIGVRFTSVTVDDRSHVEIRTETIYRVGEAPTGEATAKIGASAVVGSILGGVFGGKKGAAIGAATGAAGGTAIVAAGGPNDATLAAGSALTVRLSEPATFEIEQ